VKTAITEEGVRLVLDNGNVITSGGLNFQAGADVHIHDPDGNELGVWDCEEWRDDPELVMGAILRMAAGAEPEGV